jgi:hypothetical protein
VAGSAGVRQKQPRLLVLTWIREVSSSHKEDQGRRSDSQDSCSYQVLSLSTGDVVAGTAGVPSRVVQLIANIRHGRPVNDLTVRGRLWIHVNGRQVVWLLDVGAWKAGKVMDMNRGV